MATTSTYRTQKHNEKVPAAGLRPGDMILGQGEVVNVSRPHPSQDTVVVVWRNHLMTDEMLVDTYSGAEAVVIVRAAVQTRLRLDLDENEAMQLASQITVFNPELAQQIVDAFDHLNAVGAR